MTRGRGRRRAGQGLVETALLVPAMVIGVWLLVALGLLARANAGVEAVADEAARAGALACSSSVAVTAGQQRAVDVASGYGLDANRVGLTLEASNPFRGGAVRAVVDYRVPLSAWVPLVGFWGDIPLHHEAVEPVDTYRTTAC